MRIDPPNSAGSSPTQAAFPLTAPDASEQASVINALGQNAIVQTPVDKEAAASSDVDMRMRRLINKAAEGDSDALLLLYLFCTLSVASDTEEATVGIVEDTIGSVAQPALPQPAQGMDEVANGPFTQDLTAATLKDDLRAVLLASVLMNSLIEE